MKTLRDIPKSEIEEFASRWCKEESWISDVVYGADGERVGVWITEIDDAGDDHDTLVLLYADGWISSHDLGNNDLEEWRRFLDWHNIMVSDN